MVEMQGTRDTGCRPHRAGLRVVGGKADRVWVTDAFEDAMRGRGLAERSWVVYGQTARALASEHDLTTVTAGQVEHWLAGLSVSPKTRGAYLVRLRNLFRWMVREGLRADNPCDLIDVPRVPRGQPRPIPERYLRAAWHLAAPRERAWLALGTFCGLRAGEAARVAVEDVQDDWLRVVGKGGRERTVPMRDEVWQALEDWGWPPPRAGGGGGNPSLFSGGVGEATVGHVRPTVSRGGCPELGHLSLVPAPVCHPALSPMPRPAGRAGDARALEPEHDRRVPAGAARYGGTSSAGDARARRLGSGRFTQEGRT